MSYSACQGGPLLELAWVGTAAEAMAEARRLSARAVVGSIVAQGSAAMVAPGFVVLVMSV
jgi:hypothetical protein